MGDSLQKRKKVLEDAEDRISNLPDSLLCYILSFMPTKDAGRTSVLSSRWKYLFIFSSNLEFCDSCRNIESCPSFVNFVYRVLALRGSLHVNRFRLLCDVSEDDPHVNTWISAAVCRNAQELEIDLCISYYNLLTTDTNLGLLPYDLFTSRTLVVLKVGVDCDLNVPSNVSLPRLKTLHLESAFVVYDSFKRILSGCPVLEDLLIYDGCRFKHKVEVFEISIPTLRRLTLVLRKLYSAEFYDCEVAIDAPHLQYLRYVDTVVKGYTLKELTSLAEADICIALGDDQESGPNRLSYGLPVGKFFEAISKVVFLGLTICSVSVPEVTRCPLPTFPNLTRLKLAYNHDIGLRLLPELLCCSPNLEVLVIEHDYEDGDGSLMNLPIRPASCVSSHLKEVELKHFTGKKVELELIEYLLGGGEVLEKMTIRFSSLECPQSKKLLAFPRCSRTCRVFLT